MSEKKTGEGDMNGDVMTAEQAAKELKLLCDPLELANLQTFPRETPYEFLSNLPKPVQQRVQALKKLQLTATHIEAEFYRRVHELECEYAQRFAPLYEKRTSIVTGQYEPTSEEYDYPLYEDEELAKQLCEKVQLEGGEAGAGAGAKGDKVDAVAAAEAENKVKGIPGFWKTVWTNCETLADMIQEHDMPILEHLTDVDVNVSQQPMGFKLHFHFSPNEWFTNEVLTKEYILRCEPDKDEPFEFDGTEIVGCTGCPIDWKPSKNVTVKLMKKKQKHKQRSATRFVTKQVKADSFFNFFAPPPSPASPEDEASMDDETRELLNSDFEIGQMLRDRVVPRAILYFTGEIQDDELEDESFDEDDDELEDEEDDEDDDSDGGGAPDKV